MVHAERARTREKQPNQEYETEYLRKIEKFGEPAERRCRFYISNRGSRNRYNHHPAKHRARERGDCSKDEEQAENKFHHRNKDSIELGKRNMRRDQSLAHLFTSLRHEKFAAP